MKHAVFAEYSENEWYLNWKCWSSETFLGILIDEILRWTIIITNIYIYLTIIGNASRDIAYEYVYAFCL